MSKQRVQDLVRRQGLIVRQKLLGEGGSYVLCSLPSFFLLEPSHHSSHKVPTRRL